jgi:hypothetical protein
MAEFGLCVFILVEIAGAKGFAQLVDVHREAVDHGFGDGGHGMHRSSALFRKALHKLPHFFETLLRGLGHGNSFGKRHCARDRRETRAATP